jgi:hypothetical protein
MNKRRRWKAHHRRAAKKAARRERDVARHASRFDPYRAARRMEMMFPNAGIFGTSLATR